MLLSHMANLSRSECYVGIIAMFYPVFAHCPTCVGSGFLSVAYHPHKHDHLYRRQFITWRNMLISTYLDMAHKHSMLLSYFDDDESYISVFAQIKNRT